MREFLQDCLKIEQLAASTYRRLAVNAAYPPEIRTAFHKLGNDERAHANAIDLLVQGLSPELAAVPRIAPEIIDAAVAAAEQMARGLDDGGLSEEQALRLAVELEQQFLKVHANNAVHSYNPRIAAVFAELGRDDQDHLDTLRNCLKWWHTERKPKP